mmetsp:Transcript_25426/g.70051  ORF Transcript_25426/g.70051 Transcript_25426/m.70051 type:complete len:214 (-) Transcript_25426:200-841(-)
MSATTLEERVTALERAHHKCPRDIEVDESMRHARSAVESLGMYSSRWAWVPEPYYTWPLERRAALLKVPSTAHLCKSLLLENKKVTDETKDFWTNPRFVMVILQYEAELSTELLTKSIRKLRPVEDRLDASSFDWRVAEPEDNDRITGYKFNSVTPLGLNEEVPIVLSSAVSDLGYFWMGGGHVHLKLGLSASEFATKVKNVKVMEASVPRTK